MLKFILYWFAPLKDALLGRSLPWRYRWRLLALQPLAFLTYALKYIPYFLSDRYTVIEIPTRGKHTLRALVFRPEVPSRSQLCPLHIDFHGGAFIGGIAEYDAPFCELLSDRASAVVVSAQYRSAPVNVYPAAHEDAEDVINWVLLNARTLWNADPDSLTVSGSSAGGNLMFTAGRRAKAAVGICPVVDFRIPPWQKPKPLGFPKHDPLSWMMPLFDAYAGGSESLQVQRKNDSRLSPVLKPLGDLPERVLFIVAGIDILRHEELKFIQRLNDESSVVDKNDSKREFECIVFDKGFHGWLELPSFVIGEQGKRDREKAYDAAIDFLIKANQNC